jgi:hypothetical protein
LKPIGIVTVWEEGVVARTRTAITSNVVTMPADESSTPALRKPTHLTDSEIARRAFEMFCERGCRHGHDLDDWLQAERELTGPVTTAVA